ncbi:AcrR family transcriptional regulator [Spinactinospora alkalitolerans]|uniref:AcrR family transcriptional regulator n=1 Tax=Spinactinospora alkalitolerans TaxID=687207 RepID=A0A852TXY0_9ACTN|nr:TetR family transcriptional regulator [Spinactinospora alkalitolerans]NYE47673.1 AcrR family transcriptional regulator [Spinactinospora alkalitolerans]
MPGDGPPPSARQIDLVERAYRYALDHGLAELSLRPLASAIGSSPRVLLYLFGSKDGLVRALLARARADELALLDRLRDLNGRRPLGLDTVAEQIWAWLAAPEHRPLLTLWAEGYSRSLIDPEGPWGGFARATVEDWLDVLAAAQPPEHRDAPLGARQRTLVLAVLRGALLDLLATGDEERTTAAVRTQLAVLRSERPSGADGDTPTAATGHTRRPDR